jgi:hypothetical protein
MPMVTIEVDDDAQLSRRAWQELVYLRAGYRCELCGTRPDPAVLVERPLKGHRLVYLDAHHLNGDSKDNRLANGQCLCNSCHGRVTMTGRKREMSAGWYRKMREQGVAQRGTKRAPMSAEARARMSAARRAPGYRNPSHHVRWHVNRGIVKPDCSFCVEAEVIGA